MLIAEQFIQSLTYESKDPVSTDGVVHGINHKPANF
jgi:hypothetical protein